MFVNSRKIAISANRLAGRQLYYGPNMIVKSKDEPVMEAKKLHTTTVRANYVAAAKLPIPDNIDIAENKRFSPNRARDISATVILSQHSQGGSIDITADNTMGINTTSSDPHVQSYDCFGAVSLNSAMQSNVPTPFGGMHKFSHLNMPGGQWSQDSKFTSQDLQSSHYRTLRENARASWLEYDQNATLDKKVLATNWSITGAITDKRSYSTKAAADVDKKATAEDVDKKAATEDVNKTVTVLSKKDQLKKAFKDYGATVVTFHVAISLASLGGCYALVSGGIDLMPLLDLLGLSSSALSNKITTGASTFVIAYAIHKVFAPVRISITLGATPFIVRYLRAKGILKPKKT